MLHLPTAYRPLPTARSGISLLEVLIALGCLSVGLLAMMAGLVPLGVYEMAEATKLDQSSTLGRAAFRDLKIRGYLRPQTWVDTQYGMVAVVATSLKIDGVAPKTSGS